MPQMYNIQHPGDQFMNPSNQPEPKSPEYRQGRIDAVQEYLDTCEREGVPPGSITLHKFQQGQLEAQAEIESAHPQPVVGDDELLRKWQHLVFNLLGGSDIGYTVNPLGVTKQRKSIAASNY